MNDLKAKPLKDEPIEDAATDAPAISVCGPACIGLAFEPRHMATNYALQVDGKYVSVHNPKKRGYVFVPLDFALPTDRAYSLTIESLPIKAEPSPQPDN